MIEVLNFRTYNWGKVSALERYSCYTATLGKDIKVTGSAPDRALGVGTVLQEVPFGNIGGEYIIKSIKYRAHRGDTPLLFWEASCKEL